MRPPAFFADALRQSLFYAGYYSTASSVDVKAKLNAAHLRISGTRLMEREEGDVVAAWMTDSHQPEVVKKRVSDICKKFADDVGLGFLEDSAPEKQLGSISLVHLSATSKWDQGEIRKVILQRVGRPALLVLSVSIPPGPNSVSGLGALRWLCNQFDKGFLEIDDVTVPLFVHFNAHEGSEIDSGIATRVARWRVEE